MTEPEERAAFNGVIEQQSLRQPGDESEFVHFSGFDTNKSIPSRSARNLATSCPLTLLPALSSGGANVPRPPFPGDTVTIPPPIPLLPGRPISKSQSPEVS